MLFPSVLCFELTKFQNKTPNFGLYVAFYRPIMPLLTVKIFNNALNYLNNSNLEVGQHSHITFANSL